MNPPRKKQKLEKPGNARSLSAIAARRAALQAQTQGQNGSEISPKPKAQEEPELFDSRNLGSVLESYAKERPAVETALNRKKVVPDEPMLSDDEGASSSDSGAETPEILVNRPSVALSTFKPSKENVKELKNGGVLVRLSPGERLVILGQYEMTVQKGEITLLGATLTTSKKSHTVYAPASHSLPVIRCSATDIKSAEICFQPHKSGLETLQDLSPLFGKLWNEESGPLGADYEFLLRNQKPSSYQILFPSLQNPPKSHLQPLISPAEWNAVLSRLSSPSSPSNSSPKPQITLITGPKSSGKSTFARLLTNKLLSTPSKFQAQGLALLDLDPGQPEYSLPGTLSLTHLHTQNFGTPYTHPRPSGSSKTIRAHAIAAITPSMDTSLYMACAVDLHTHYLQLLKEFPKCPLVVNTPGWVLGSGLEILVQLITSFHPTEVLYMSSEGPQEVVDTLREACSSSSSKSTFYTLPSQSSEFTTRTAAHLRTMQYMSYFHLKPNHQNGKEEEGFSWNNTPLTSMRPWEIMYEGENKGIWGVMCYGEQPPPSLLAETINGSLLSLVVVDDDPTPSDRNSNSTFTRGNKKSVFANPSPRSKSKEKEKAEDTNLDFISLTATIPTPSSSSSTSSFPPITKTTTKTSRPHTHQPRPTTPKITPTPEGIPYFHPAPLLPLSPATSQTIGLLLVRGIDIPRRRIQVLTSIPASLLKTFHENTPGKKIVLISGKLDIPGWSYTEELHLREAQSRAQKEMERMEREYYGPSSEEDSDGVGGEEEKGDGKEDGFESSSIPWVEKLEGSKGRGVGARVWRVRRDLGKMGEP